MKIEELQRTFVIEINEKERIQLLAFLDSVETAYSGRRITEANELQTMLRGMNII